jgi:hypothetical protein
MTAASNGRATALELPGKGKGKAGRKAGNGAARARQVAAQKAQRWAHWYTGAAVVLSAGLNPRTYLGRLLEPRVRLVRRRSNQNRVSNRRLWVVVR